ncbi:hypothetical protein SAMN05880590_1137 [Rhizobium sp. RU35A]|uniref:hypothetical protein n=1 Tax=Rhizobium sp. RU35A TaxID=1907414 RepID=UPI00095753C9|nr:hypothetical protein [Rhizobium sp. RU35A]SIR16361.1 hypothetical protein SAMN05880590_1137 [Rhizobium sp. RU35A]
MTLRINSIAESDNSGASFSPTDDFTLQAEFGAGSKAVVEIEARADSNATWLKVGAISYLTEPPIATFRKLPLVRITMRNNTAGATVKAWTDV